MIKTYLRIDLFIEDGSRLKLIDHADLELNEDVYDFLQGFDDCDYAELLLVTSIGYDLHESLTACFKRIKLKGKRDYSWLLCPRKEI